MINILLFVTIILGVALIIGLLFFGFMTAMGF